MEILPTRSLLRWHRYVGLVTAPLILMFAVSGVWQVFRYQQSRKDGSYVAPPALTFVSDIHMAEGMGRNPAAQPLRWVLSAAGLMLAFATSLGIVAALRVTRPRWLAVVLLLGGTLLPALLLLVAKLGAPPPPPPGT